VRVWSTPARVVLVLAAVGLLAGTGVFLAGLFLHVAPDNAVSGAYRRQVDAVVYPEFEQNWKLFAPNPLQQNIAVDARLQTIADDGRIRTGEWVGLTAQDIAAIRHNPAPSHVDQNLLRRAWDFYDATHPVQQDGTTETSGPRGKLAEQYLKRIALQRLGRTYGGERILQIQFRSGSTTIAPPAWSDEKVSTEPQYRELPWWPVNDEDYRGLA